MGVHPFPSPGGVRLLGGSLVPVPAAKKGNIYILVFIILLPNTLHIQRFASGVSLDSGDVAGTRARFSAFGL